MVKRRTVSAATRAARRGSSRGSAQRERCRDAGTLGVQVYWNGAVELLANVP